VTRSREPKNPFYALRVVAGVAFAMAASAYFVMALRGADPRYADTPHGLMAWLERHGLTALFAELVVLGLATFGAMVTDEYWKGRAVGGHSSSRVHKEPADEGESARGS
jgi:hypothetical protein